MPSGHPPVGAGRGPRLSPSGFYEPPEDGAIDDPALPPGTIAVRIADAEDKPVPRAPVTLGILKNTVAKGESRQQVQREADGDGLARFEGLEVGSGVSYRVSTPRGAALYAVTPFGLSDKAGKSVVLHSFEVTSDIDEALVGAQAIVYLSMREDSMQLEHLFNIINVGPVTWVPEGVTIALPAGFKAFNKPEEMTDTRFDELAGKGAALRGTFKPGQSSLTFRYQVPLAGDESQGFRIEMPPHVAQARVMVEASSSMGVEVAGFPAAQKTQGRDGKRLLVTERQVARAEGGLKELAITVKGLPTPGPGRWVAVGLAAAAVLAAGAYLAQRRGDEALPEDARVDLEEARDALLDEIVALERAHRSGEVGPKAYARIRAALADALWRIVTRLEEGAPRRPAA
jgi:hypothetical protein